MRQTLEDITNYIDFLRDTGYFVCVSCFGDNFGECLEVLREYEVHRLGVCSYMKSNPKMFHICIKNKRILERKNPKEPYYSHCYAGVEEYVYPIICEKKMIMCINISGYRGKLKRSEKLKEYSAKYMGEKFSDLYSELSDSPPSISEIKKMIRPLEYMICALYRKCKENSEEYSPQKAVFNKAITYIYNNYPYKITCADVANSVCYSEAHLRHIFYRQCGKPIMEYINDVRLSQAEKMLTETTVGITDIAYSVGFSDSNYFSCAFKKKYKLPPKAYRKSNSQK